MTIDKKLEKCRWLDSAKKQMKSELKRYGHLDNSQGFIDKGCDVCNGYDINCSYRYPKYKK